MKGLKRWSQALLGIFLAVLSTVYFATSYVNATSSYDNIYHQASKVVVGMHGEYGLNLADQDLTTTWQQYITNKSMWHSPTDNGDADTSLSNALANGRWGVSQRIEYNNGNGYPTAGYGETIEVFWTEDTSLALSWDSTNGIITLSGNSVHTITIYSSGYLFGGGSTTPVAYGYSTNGNFNISTTNQPNGTDYSSCSPTACAQNLFVNTSNLNYPSGYAGTTIPAAYYPTTVLFPKVGYTVDGLDIKALLLTKESDLPVEMSQYGLTWNLQQQQSDGSYKSIDSQSYTDMLQPYHYTFSTTGNYQLIVSFYGPPPLAAPPPGYQLHSVVMPFKIDGSSFSSSTSLAQCDNAGNCQSPSAYQDCSTFGSDLVGGFGCVMHNFGVWIQATLVTLFVPDSQYFKDYFTNFQSMITTKLGFLVWPLQFAVGFINAFFAGLHGTQNICDWSFGNLFGGNLKLNFCSFQQQFPAAFSTAIYMIQAFTVFVLISGLYRDYRRVVRT